MYSQSLDRTTKEGERSRDQKLIILGNLASLYTKMEKYPKALKLSMALADSYIALNGDEHPGLATILNTQAIAIHKLGRLEEAEKIFIRAGKIAENTLSENHRTTALIRTGLAMVYLDQGRYAESDKLLQKALATFLKAFGKEHLSIGAVCSRIGDWHRVQNLHADAISYYQRALDIISKKVPDNALELENVTSHYALSLRALGRDQEALKLEEEAKKIRERRAAAMQINPQDQDIFLNP